MKLKIFIIPVLAFFVLIVSCKKDDAEPKDEKIIKLFTHSVYGEILVDGDGRALYFYSKDADGSSQCSDGCLDAWPVFFAENIMIDTQMSKDDFGFITRADNTPQVTYKGWPLYYYVSDVDEGVVTCDGVEDAWFVAKPDYTIMLANNQLVGADENNYNSNYELGNEVVQYFVDKEGNTLYTFVDDEANTNTYTASDFSNNGSWPVYEEDLKNVPSTLDKSLFSNITVFGKTQLTYKGWPLYYYGSDSKRGETKGVSVPTPGRWPVAVQTVNEAPVP